MVLDIFKDNLFGNFHKHLMSVNICSKIMKKSNRLNEGNGEIKADDN